MQLFTVELGYPDGRAKVVASAKVRDPILIVSGKRGTKPTFAVQFSRNGVPELLPDGSLLRYTVKQKGQYDSAAVVSAWDGDWTTPGDTTGSYTAIVSYDTALLNDLMLSPDGDPTNDVPSLTLMGAFSWGPSGEDPIETDQFDVKVTNLINNAVTSAATPAGIHPSPLVTLTDYTGGAGCLDGLATLTTPTPSILTFAHPTDGVRMFVLKAGTTAADSPNIVHPTDYDASTNAKFWAGVF